MDSGFFVSGVAGDMTAQKLNTIAHNLANVNTTGYMLDRTAFSTILANTNDAGKTSNKLPQAYMTMDHQYVNGDKGIIRQTGNDLDFALRGDGYFQVMTSEGGGADETGYTRAGNFHLNGEGMLMTEGNLPVLDAGGSKITLQGGVITASEDGQLLVDNVEVARLGIYEIKDLSLATKASGTILKIDKTNVGVAENGVTLHQGMLEGSNVNAVLMMVEMMQNTRSNQSMMKILEQYNQQEGQITQTVGRLPG